MRSGVLAILFSFIILSRRSIMNGYPHKIMEVAYMNPLNSYHRDMRQSDLKNKMSRRICRLVNFYATCMIP